MIYGFVGRRLLLWGQILAAYVLVLGVVGSLSWAIQEVGFDVYDIVVKHSNQAVFNYWANCWVGVIR